MLELVYKWEGKTKSGGQRTGILSKKLYFEAILGKFQQRGGAFINELFMAYVWVLGQSHSQEIIYKSNLGKDNFQAFNNVSSSSSVLLRGMGL